MAASIAIKLNAPDTIQIPVLRLNAHPLAKTILRHLLMQTVVDAATNDARFIHACEPHLTREVTDALIEMGFVKSATDWIKLVARGFLDVSTAHQWLTDAGLPSEESSSPAAIVSLCRGRGVDGPDRLTISHLLESRPRKHNCLTHRPRRRNIDYLCLS